MKLFGPKTESLVETHVCEEAMTPDRDLGIIPGVKVCGLVSKNGRDYAPSALKEAIGLYEGAKVNVNHPRGANPNAPRDYQDRLGSIRNVRYVEGKGLYGDLHYNPKHAVAPQLEWDAEHSPSSVGFSHNADGSSSLKGGRRLVEQITRVKSVDLVADPATADGLREHVESEVTLEQIIEASAGSESPLLPLLEAFVANQPAAAKLPVATQLPSQPGEANTALHDGLKAAVVAIFDDASLDDAGKVAKIKQIINVESKVTDDPNEGSEMDEKQVKESIDATLAEALKPILESNASLQKELDARKILEGKGAAVSPQLLEELVACDDKPAMEKLVEGWSPAKLGKPKPAIRGLQESVGSFPATHEEFVRALRRG